MRPRDVLSCLARSRRCTFAHWVGLIEVLSEWRCSRAAKNWVERVDAPTLDNGNLPEIAVAAAAAAGPYPTVWPGPWAKAWLEKRGLRVLYRGQARLREGEDFLSPVARGDIPYNNGGVEASKQLVDKLVSEGASLDELRTDTAMYGSSPTPTGTLRHSFARTGAAGIPFSDRLPVAAGYAKEAKGVVYATVQSEDDARQAQGWSYTWEREHVALHRVPRQAIIAELPWDKVHPYGPADAVMR